MKDKEKGFVAAYCRSCCADMDSIKKQLNEIREFCRDKGWLLGPIYVDNGYSGRNKNRPALQQLLQDIGSFPDWKTLLIVDDSYLSRNYDHIQEIKEMLDLVDIDLVNIRISKQNISEEGLIKSLFQVLEECLQ